MFSDARSKKVVLMSHCILNANAKADSTAYIPGANEQILQLLMQLKVGIMQMPCPEILAIGLDRGDPRGGERPILMENTRIRAEMQKSQASEVLDTFVNQIVLQVEQYINNGFNVVGIIGVDRSPTCGISKTTIDNEEVDGEGVIMKQVREALAEKDIHLNMVGTKALKTDEALLAIREMVEKSEAAFNKSAAKAFSASSQKLGQS